MAPLNAVSQDAIDRLRKYTPPPTTYGDVPLSRRAAVLILLYADLHGDLRVVITIRAKTLSSCKADTLSETAFETARREAREEIGLPDINQTLPSPFAVEHLCELPANLAKTELVVRPCVALLHSFDPATGMNADPETELIPRLDALHQFFVSNADHAVRPRSPGNQTQNAAVETLSRQEESGQVPHYRVFGMTARMLVDAARVAYARDPDFEHNSHFGDEEMISKLRRLGRLSEKRRPGEELTRETMERAAKLS
ncbi:Peroxisomal coenzyme A diphosphatase 1, peroxisomal [Penicillium ucsense]|uniref:Peroxisomal coenzyme A diphosphatase 1, peroxisomal n=1 Tax=Penicillium ucsense TaxID=2839758 RepID=A0A8J8VW26_9EURO|nr:Peroxisomal coenzyme A diphosphatase 1, peroxisomal [Penicillium ucsense]KAF7729836.1 Peroxisomal coenzyme A diphosphatase 1, peroxisomal [Penicillium ucsense]